ncbi:MAG: methyltransferase domain-containing protein [Chloroflexi bacterium]|nr:methyltransferase domain-containing protein [Chloroflexota bacterium]
MCRIARFMRFFFHHFYHTFAWTYDFVSTVVSIGRWQDWIKTTLPLIHGTRILEIGFGPGHLQRILLDRKLFTVGVDESPQMARLAKSRLDGSANLTRGLAQSLPFTAQTFETVLSTFPAEYIFDPRTLSDVYRVLHNGGRFIVLPFAWIVGRKFLDRAAAWLFRVTGETPQNVLDVINQRAVHPLEQVGFKVEIRQVEVKSSVVLLMIAQKG